jgi:hypothetical protein
MCSVEKHPESKHPGTKCPVDRTSSGQNILVAKHSEGQTSLRQNILGANVLGEKHPETKHPEIKHPSEIFSICNVKKLHNVGVFVFMRV